MPQSIKKILYDYLGIHFHTWSMWSDPVREVHLIQKRKCIVCNIVDFRHVRI